MATLDADELQRVYHWVDEIPLSRPKRNIARDFSDGVMMAEIVAHYFPKIVELHNYAPANSISQKVYNWTTLNKKVLRRLHFSVSRADIEDAANSTPGTVEAILRSFMIKLSKLKEKQNNGEWTPGSMRKSKGAGKDMDRSNVSMSKSGITEDNSMIGGVGGEDVTAIIAEKDETISELRETVEILEVKIKKLEQLVRLKDSKISALTAKLQKAGV